MAINHPTLSVVVADSLRELIAAGRLAPGARLNERELCSSLKVSRTPLREAFRILSAEGLVELTPKHGARVVELSEDDVANIFEVLAVTEGLAARLAAERGTSDQLDQVAHLHREMMAAYEARDMRRYAIAAKGTHDVINEAAANPTLREIYLRLNAQVQKLRYRSNLEGDDNWSRSIAAHENFVAALLARKGVLVERLLKEHVLAKKALAIGKDGPGRALGRDAPPPATPRAGSAIAKHPGSGPRSPGVARPAEADSRTTSTGILR